MIETLTILNWMWAALGVYWLVSALATKKTEVNEASLWRFLRLSIMCLVFTMLLTTRLRYGLLGWRFVPDSNVIRWTGVALTAAGLFFCVWARHHLGAYWSDKVVLKVDHQLIRSGPYAYLRHPIYSGVLLGVAGTALAIGEERGAVALMVMTVNYWVKARREEKILAEKFGDSFAEYRRNTGFLVPGF
jgi:protein-S-isoprenylcysteine O-methyltransferase Ste14